MNVRTEVETVVKSVTLTLSEKEFLAIELAVANVYIPLFMTSAEKNGLDAEEMRQVLSSLYKTFTKE